MILKFVTKKGEIGVSVIVENKILAKEDVMCTRDKEGIVVICTE